MTSLRRLLLSALVLVVPALAAAQTYTIAPTPFQTAFDNSGRIINNACVWTYTAGTTTPATTYSTATGTSNTNPIRSDSAGRFTAYLAPGANYKFVYEAACTPPAHGVVLRTADNVAGTPASASTVDVADAVAGEAISAGQCVYLSDGSGGKNSGQWYKCDSANPYSSTLNDIGIAPSAISAAATGTVRRAGVVTGLSALSIGSNYYVGTSGALTSTAPANGRLVGQAQTATEIVIGDGALSSITITSPRIATTVLGPLFTGCGIRLTLTSGTPVTTIDVTAAVTVYATPYGPFGFGAGVCSFYDGSATWTTLTFTETSIPLGTLTSALPYDVFCYNNSGTMACELLAWTNTTTRATALVLQNGILVKTGATTRRFIGSIYTTSTTTTEDSLVKRDVCNYYNRVRRNVLRRDTTASFTYTIATWQQFHADALNQVEALFCWQETPASLAYMTQASNGSAAVGAAIGIGVDSTTVPSTSVAGGSATLNNNYISWGIKGEIFPGVGKHTFAMLQISAASGTTTWYGIGSLFATIAETGLSGFVEN